MASGNGRVTYVLFPLPEPRFLRLDLLSEFLPESLLFLLEFGIVELLDLGLAEFACLHLLLTVVFVMNLLSSRDKIEHMGTNQKRP